MLCVSMRNNFNEKLWSTILSRLKEFFSMFRFARDFLPFLWSYDGKQPTVNDLFTRNYFYCSCCLLRIRCEKRGEDSRKKAAHATESSKAKWLWNDEHTWHVQHILQCTSTTVEKRAEMKCMERKAVEMITHHHVHNRTYISQITSHRERKTIHALNHR